MPGGRRGSLGLERGLCGEQGIFFVGLAGFYRVCRERGRRRAEVCAWGPGAQLGDEQGRWTPPSHLLGPVLRWQKPGLGSPGKGVPGLHGMSCVWRCPPRSQAVCRSPPGGEDLFHTQVGVLGLLLMFDTHMPWFAHVQHLHVSLHR